MLYNESSTMETEADRWFWLFLIAIFAGFLASGCYISRRKKQFEDHPNLADFVVGTVGIGVSLILVLVTIRLMAVGRIAFSAISAFGFSYVGYIAGYRFFHWLWMVVREIFVRLETH